MKKSPLAIWSELRLSEIVNEKIYDFFLTITDSVKAGEFANALTSDVLLMLGKKPLTNENIHDALTKVIWDKVS